MLKTYSLAAATLAAFVSSVGVHTARAEVTFPNDVYATCPITPGDLHQWARYGSEGPNGPFNPPDSDLFDDDTNCNFYRWGAQMFLFLTSPNTAHPGYVFDGPFFYDVINHGNDDFTFEQFLGDAPNAFGVRGLKGDEAIGGTGQAGGGDVLLSQKGSLTYYGIHVNEAYAEYLTAQKAGQLSGTLNTNFPSDQPEMEELQKVIGKQLPYAEALVLELKTSWVDARTVGASRYLVINAEVPAFDRSSATDWPQTGTETMPLAMVGMHVVGTAKGHPEMIWASFEHIDNAPNLSYYYMTSARQPALAMPDTAGNWTFFDTMPPAGTSPMIATVAATSDTGIAAVAGKTIGPVSVVQMNPFGLAPEDMNTALANSDLVSLNGSLLNMLQQRGDVRGNYYQIGSIWTQKGQMPTGDSDPNIRGGDRLANSTLETFHQYPDENNGFQSKNCFLCHSTSSDSDLKISHIYSGLQPLP